MQQAQLTLGFLVLGHIRLGLGQILADFDELAGHVALATQQFLVLRQILLLDLLLLDCVVRARSNMGVSGRHGRIKSPLLESRFVRESLLRRSAYIACRAVPVWQILGGYL